ncbi:MAG: hypothetical protein EXS39_00500 [Opitutaceae bacterium]|nr:hypothetical protein [Opitutaceae bacterium]
MNSVERVRTALKLGQPDRVPILEFLVDGNVARAAAPGCRDVADCMDRLGLAGRWLHPDFVQQHSFLVCPAEFRRDDQRAP